MQMPQQPTFASCKDPESLADKRASGGDQNVRKTMAAELLSRCGMISGAGSRSAFNRRLGFALSPQKDYPFIILESLNLSPDLRV